MKSIKFQLPYLLASMANVVLPAHSSVTQISSEIIEVERKFEINKPELIHIFVADFEFKGEKRDIDIYYDTPTGDLYKKGIFLRKRNEAKFEFKFNMDDFSQQSATGEHSSCSEFSFSLPLNETKIESINSVLNFLGMDTISAASIEHLLESNNLVEFVVINKNRKTYLTPENYTVCIDDVDTLGQFIEIERLAMPGDDINLILRQIDEIYGASQESKHITVGYVELYLRKYNFDLYKSGKYILPEDISI